MSTDVTVSVL